MLNAHRSKSSRIVKYIAFAVAFPVFLALAILVTSILLEPDSVTLGDLSASDRLRLLEQAQNISPSVYQPYPPSGPMQFYRMKPGTNYDNVLGDSFRTNELGFRTIGVSPKATRTRRLLVVGDSWTYGPFVPENETFPSVLSEYLNSQDQKWEVFNLSMLGWNTKNEVSALRMYIGQIKPDLVVISPTSNDIDDGFGIWEGRLVNSGFDSGAIFRYSHTYETRWYEVFGLLQRTVDELAAINIPTLVFFLAEWRSLAPYYAAQTGFHARYTVLPEEFTSNQYRLPTSVDPGRHPTVEGYRLIAKYLFNALIDKKYLFHMDRLPLEVEPSFPEQSYDEKKVMSEFGFWSQFADRYDLIPLRDDKMGSQGLFSIPLEEGKGSISIQLRLIDENSLYPIKVELRVASYDGEIVVANISSPSESTRYSLPIPDSVKKYPFVEVDIRANRMVLQQGSGFPVSMRRPVITLKE